MEVDSASADVDDAADKNNNSNNNNNSGSSSSSSNNNNSSSNNHNNNNKNNNTGGPSPSDIRARTVALTSLPDTVNDARMQALVQAATGGAAMVQLSLQPSKGTAKIEFQTVAAAGRAILALDGKEIDGKAIRAEGVDDLRRGQLPGDRGGACGQAKGSRDAGPAKQQSRVAFVPLSVRRPAVSRGPKKGLGFAAAVAKSTTDDKSPTDARSHADESAAPEGQARNVVGKTNADFKAMFILSGPKKEEDSQGDDGGEQ